MPRARRAARGARATRVPATYRGRRARSRVARAQQRGIGAIHAAVTTVHLLAALVDDAHRAVGRLDPLAEIELHLVRRALQSALDAGLGALEHGVGRRAGRGGHERREREADTP